MEINSFPGKVQKIPLNKLGLTKHSGPIVFSQTLKTKIK
ncbi:hypothetical protein ADICYQ_0336 [Cyclobacterium qasimii M12-11B]|uniref:Uncharacterized protein n=1 Tax=Cyclobacterium qasimii M12-11B TaxID=641524 RepID=S7WXC4_9BACT|nr:hypothetical protein ADICYQ_0336 [Cyclobacterium qasimii M12-11B]